MRHCLLAGTLKTSVAGFTLGQPIDGRWLVVVVIACGAANLSFGSSLNSRCYRAFLAFIFTLQERIVVVVLTDILPSSVFRAEKMRQNRVVLYKRLFFGFLVCLLGSILRGLCRLLIIVPQRLLPFVTILGKIYMFEPKNPVIPSSFLF